MCWPRTHYWVWTTSASNLVRFVGNDVAFVDSVASATRTLMLFFAADASSAFFRCSIIASCIMTWHTPTVRKCNLIWSQCWIIQAVLYYHVFTNFRPCKQLHWENLLVEKESVVWVVQMCPLSSTLLNFFINLSSILSLSRFNLTLVKVEHYLSVLLTHDHFMEHLVREFVFVF